MSTNARAHLLPMNRTQSRRLSLLKHRKQVERIGEKAADREHLKMRDFALMKSSGVISRSTSFSEVFQANQPHSFFKSNHARPSLEFMRELGRNIAKAVIEGHGEK